MRRERILSSGAVASLALTGALLLVTALAATMSWPFACETTGCRGWRTVDIHPRLTRVLSLDNQLVFAYSRISGDGKLLVYSSEPGEPGQSLRPSRQVLHVYALELRQTIYEDTGIDGYWSPDGRYLVYKAIRSDGQHVAVWNRETAEVTFDVIPVVLGDYYSWGNGPRGDTLVTINAWFVTIRGLKAVTDPARMPECPEIGRGARPLVSRDGLRVSVFVSDELVLRNLRDCGDIVRTGIVAGKADWSRNGRYLAFHTSKEDTKGYDIGVIDTLTRTFRRISLEGSSLFPSWTDDDSLVFRYDGPDYQGFIRADDVLNTITATGPPASKLRDGEAIHREWREILPGSRIALVLLWAAWGAHSAEALREFSAANLDDCRWPECSLISLYDPSSSRDNVERILAYNRLASPVVEAPWLAVRTAGGLNQTPSYLLFQDECLTNRALGAMSRSELGVWFSQRKHSQKPAGKCGAVSD